MIRPIVLLVREPGAEERVESFAVKELRIGAAADDQLRLVHPSVSKEYRARIRSEEGDLLLTSYCSAAPTSVNGQRVNMCGVVHGDVIRAGEVELIVVSQARLDPREQALVDDIASHPEDEGVRSVYADWLEENGLSNRAEYLRLDSAVHKALEGSWRVTIREDIALLSGLAKSLPPAWLALVRRRPKPR